MRVTFHDPGHLGMRRAVRAAVATPVGLALALYVFDDTDGVVFTLFGIVGLLVNADFAGSAAQRLASYLTTGVAGSVVLVIGWAISPTTWMAVTATVLVAFLLSFLNLLRGPIAVGTPAVMLIYVVAVSLESGPGDLGPYLGGWWLAVAVSTATALLLLPRSRRADVRKALAEVFSTAARGTERMWLSASPAAPDDAFADLPAAVAEVNRLYNGQPYRTWGLTRRDQALTLIVDMANDMQLVLRDAFVPRAVFLPSATLPAVQALARAIVASLDDLAADMLDPRRIPDVTAIDHARNDLLVALEAWVLEQAHGGRPSAEISEEVAGNHGLRILGLLVEQIVQVARNANGAPAQDTTSHLPVPVLHRSTLLLSQLHFSSPWLRNSLRSSLGLGLAVLVVQLTGVEKGFWVLLGVISILRFDAVGTRSFAWRAIAGTALGVVVASAILAVVGDQEWVLWILLPVATFLAAWAAVAIGFTSGQFAFSMMILFALGIVNWPPQPALAIVRLEDIALGAGVAIVVGVLLWPRGAVGHLRREVSIALRAAADYLAAAIDVTLDRVDEATIEERRRTAIESAQRASETYDVSLMQRGPAEDLRPWTRAVASSYLLVSTGRIVATMGQTHPNVHQHSALMEALAQARDELTDHWDAVADEADGSAPVPSGSRAPTPVPPPRIVMEHIDTTADARALIVSIWTVDWVHHLDHLDPVPST